MNHDKADLRAKDLFDDDFQNQVKNALSGKLIRWELPLRLRHRVDQLTRLAKDTSWCKANVHTPKSVRLVDTSESDVPDPYWYEWCFHLCADYTDGDERGFTVDVREESPEILAHHIRTYGKELVEMADKIETMDR